MSECLDTYLSLPRPTSRDSWTLTGATRARASLAAPDGADRKRRDGHNFEGALGNLMDATGDFPTVVGPKQQRAECQAEGSLRSAAVPGGIDSPPGSLYAVPRNKC